MAMTWLGRITGAAAAVGLVATGLAGAGPAAAAAPGQAWSDPTVLDVDTTGFPHLTPRADWIDGASLAVAPDGGHAFAMWDGHEGTTRVTRTASWNGSTWSVPQPIAPPDPDAPFEHRWVSSDGSRGVAAWVRDGAVRAATWDGSAWGAPTIVSGAGQTVEEPLLAVSADGATAVVVWPYTVWPDDTVRLASRWGTRSGSSMLWAAPTVVETGTTGWSLDALSLAAGGTRAVLVATGIPDLGLRAWPVTAAGWSAPRLLDPASPAGDPVHPRVGLSADGSTAIAVWCLSQAGWGAAVRAAVLTGAAWSPSSSLTTATAPENVGGAALAVGGGGSAVTLWERGELIDAAAWDGSSWTSPVTVGRGSKPRAAAAAAGTAAVAGWMGDYGLQGAGWDGTSWSAPVLMWSDDAGATFPGSANEFVWQASADAATVVSLGDAVNGPWYLAATSFRPAATAPPVVASVVGSGAVTGGQVWISGTALVGARVTFGGLPAVAGSGRTNREGTDLVIEAPPHAAGTVDVVVTTPRGSARRTYTYDAPAGPPAVGPPPAGPPVSPSPNRPPTAAMVRPLAAVSLTTTIAVAWTGADPDGAAVTFRVQRAVKAPGVALGRYLDWGGTRTARAASMTGALRGYAYCFRVLAVDPAGLLSAWSAPRCATVPSDDRALGASKAWARATSRTAYLRTVTTTRTRGAVLSVARSRGSALALVLTRVPGGGTIGVYLKGRRVAVVATTAGRLMPAAVVRLAVRTTGQPLVLRVESPGTRGVAVDGLAQLP